MDLSRYQVNKDPERDGLYWYYSVSEKRTIRKVVEFQLWQYGIFNLALGDEKQGIVDYSSASDNDDAKKVLVTITSIVEDYLNEHRHRIVFITGNTPVKTRFYRMHLSNNLVQIIEAGYEVYGVFGENIEVFTKGKNYEGFLVRKP